jgi:hypothetical protein
MASIYRRPHSPYLFAAWRGGAGRLFLRSTKQKQKERYKARAVALESEPASRLAAGELTEQHCHRIVNDILERNKTGESFRSPITVFLFLSAEQACIAGKRVGPMY